MRKAVLIALISLTCSSFFLLRADDTCARCGVVCGRTASNCMISQDGSSGWCSWDNGAEVKWANGKVEETVYVCE